MIHGESKKRKVEISEEEKKKQDEQAQKVLETIDYFLKVRKGLAPKPENPLAYSEKIAQLCSDIPTIYNYRREIIAEKFEAFKSLIFEDFEQLLKESQIINQLISSEFDLINGLIRRHPKSYTLWTHRQWMVQQSRLIDQTILEQKKYKNLQIKNTLRKYEDKEIPLFNVLDREFGLCAKMLSLDERNFHVWNYRHWLVSISNCNQEDAFTKKKIDQNFSNFSAYHFRSKYLAQQYNSIQQIQSRIANKKVNGLLPLPLNVVKQELELIQSAIYIQPKEQGVYLYQKCILSIIQPFGLLGIASGFQIKQILPEVKDSSLVLLFSRRVTNVNLSIQKNDKELIYGEDFIYKSENNQDFSSIYTLELFNNDMESQLKICVKNLLFEDNNENTIQEENFNSKFFIPIVVLGQMKNDTFFIQSIESDNRFDETINELEALIQENIEFIEQILQEEPKNRFANYQLVSFLQFLIDLKCLNLSKENIKKTIEIATRILQINESLQVDGKKDVSVEANISLWKTKLIILKNLGCNDKQPLPCGKVFYDKKQIQGFRFLDLINLPC